MPEQGSSQPAQPPLEERHCVPCERGTPPLTRAEIEPLLAQLQGWTVEEADAHHPDPPPDGGRENLDRHLRLARTFKFKGFMPAVDFVNRIAPIAEAEGHHPDLIVSWGSVTVHLWTHAAGGLTENDFVLAAKIDRVN
jgi:4a-hydroxytetrahydrobiopterin dehydratase